MTVRPAGPDDIPAIVALQPAAFPPPFDPAYWWQESHLRSHQERFPVGQFVAEIDRQIVGACSNIVISEENWQAHRSWDETVGGPHGERHDPRGTTLYGLDISVAPEYRGRGVGRGLYGARFDLIRKLGLRRYGTACRVPGMAEWAENGKPLEEYVPTVTEGRVTDRTLTPLLRFGLIPFALLRNYMEDPESLDCACLLEKTF